MPDFSKEQLEVIQARGCNILVSAAAGSGKTTVLVERIIQRITDKNDPVDIDEMLVLTYTRAAAGEMRERIASAIAEALNKAPDDDNLIRQSALIYNAQITTIDSFCLNILRNNFTEIGLEPGFRTASENEIKFLAGEVLDNTIEQILGDNNIVNLDLLLKRFQSKDNLNKLKAAISELHGQALNAPFVEEYLEDRRSDYDIADVKALYNLDWWQEMVKNVSDNLKDTVNQCDRLIEFCEDSGLDGYVAALQSDRDTLAYIAEADTYSEIGARLKSMDKWATLGRVSGEEENKKYAQNSRKLYKDLINSLTSDYYSYDPETIVARMRENNKIVGALIDAVILYHRNLESEKRERGIITFSDMEHMALKILVRREDGKLVPTQTAIDLRLAFKELMIDEYQDSNYIQETLIHSISGEDEGRYDRFMVGDIKQSIYRFRNANPTLFLEKYKQYKKGDEHLRRIDLSNNYRSRESVTNAVNTVFERIMDEKIGGVNYDENARLYASAKYSDVPCDTTAELLLMNPNNEEGLTGAELESLMIANRIKELVADYKVQDKETKQIRNCNYKDIVILLRSGGDMLDILSRTLEEQGIPAYVTSKSGYFDAWEVVTVLNYLKVLDNPYNDIELYGVLTSVFGGLSADDMAVLRIVCKEKLYNSCKYIITSDIETILDGVDGLTEDDIVLLKKKLTVVMEKIDGYRDMIPFTPIHSLIRRIYRDTGYVNYVLAMPGGDQKRANVLMLLSKAENYENDGFKGLFNFTRYIEQLHKYDTDEGEAAVLSENANVVRIMTMHKSKGLEFPVCILAGLAKSFNRGDEKAEIAYHVRYGLGLNYIDVSKRAKYKDIRKKFITDMIHRDSISEELRVFYVAMTRAKEKLIMTAVSDNFANTSKTSINTGIVPDDLRMKISSNLDIIRLAHQGDDWDGQIKLRLFTYEDVVSSEIKDLIETTSRRELLGEIRVSDLTDEQQCALNGLKEQVAFVYEHGNLRNLYTKTSVSELKMAAIHQGLLSGEVSDEAEKLFELHDETGYVPRFARDEAVEASGAKRGSAYHRVMELVDFKNAGEFDANKLDVMMKQHVESGALLNEDYELINKDKVVKFMHTDLAKRMSEAAKRGELYLERPFVLGVSADRLGSDYPSDEQVLIQGIIDAYFIEDGEIVLMDYKTDSVTRAEELIERYHTQLDYYKEALSRITGLRVKEILIYSFKLDLTINSVPD